MTTRQKPSFATRPTGEDAWVKAADLAPATPAQSYTARLTIDVTPVMRGRLKIIAFRRGVTVADMIRALLEREYPGEDSVS